MTTQKHGFTKTNEKVEITFNGWDGKSYDGETRKLNVWTTTTFPQKKFVNIRKGGFERIDGSHYSIDAFFEVTERMVIEKATGIAHPVADYYTSFDL